MPVDREADRERAAREWLTGRGLTHRNSKGESVVEDEDVCELVKLLAATETACLEEADRQAIMLAEAEGYSNAILSIIKWLRDQATQRRAP